MQKKEEALAQRQEEQFAFLETKLHKERKVLQHNLEHSFHRAILKKQHQEQQEDVKTCGGGGAATTKDGGNDLLLVSHNTEQLLF